MRELNDFECAAITGASNVVDFPRDKLITILQRDPFELAVIGTTFLFAGSSAGAFYGSKLGATGVIAGGLLGGLGGVLLPILATYAFAGTYLFYQHIGFALNDVNED